MSSHESNFPEVRAYDDEDARRDLAAEMLKRHVRAAGITVDYDADIEYLAGPLAAFADEWARMLNTARNLGWTG
jgi:hypothetical protein